MERNLSKGENVCHRARSEWGVGKITSVEKGGAIRVTFVGDRILSIAKGGNYLVRVDKNGKKI